MENKYPEHEKLHAIRDQSQIVGEFLDWLNAGGFTICEFGGFFKNEYWPTGKSIQNWLEEFFNIDGAKIDEEKRQMLDEIRKSAEK